MREKIRVLIKIVSLILMLSLFSGVSIVLKTAKAMPVERIVSRIVSEVPDYDVNGEKRCAGLLIRHKSRWELTNAVNAQRILDIMATYRPYVKKFMQNRCAAEIMADLAAFPHIRDSFKFICLFEHIRAAYPEANNRTIDELKHNILKHVMFLRSEKEFKMDIIAANSYDARMHTKVERRIVELYNEINQGAVVLSYR